MSNDAGIQITNDVNIPTAKDTDFVINTLDFGAMHEVVTLPLKYVDAQVTSQYQLPTTIYQHNLGFTPAYLAYASQGILSGWQNFADGADTVNVNDQRIQVSFGTGSDITVIVFGEQIDT